MPQLGETVAEGKITKWFKAAGDAVKPGDNLFEIETDKTSMEVPSTSAGVLAEIRVSAGETAPVGAVVAVISDGASSGVTAPSARPTPAPASTRVSSSPAAATAPVERRQPVAMEPFREVRSPDRNFGRATLSGD